MKKERTNLDNAELLKKCRKIDNTIVSLYVMLFIFITMPSLFLIFLRIVQASSNAFDLLVDTVIIRPAMFAAGAFACYQHNTKFIFIANIIATIDIFISMGNAVLLLIIMILSVVTFLNNKKYHYLEKQDGFPQFSERLENQNFDTLQRSIKDEFEQNFERYKKTSSDSMTEISSEEKSDDMGKQKTEVKNFMDEI